MPSLAQLDQAVREFIAENPMDLVTVVVDASFGHRIDPSELPAYEEAEVAGEVVSPPAGAIGRGDAFLLLIAEKTGATVLSNDSFQEFHGDHSWLFDKGRLIGGKPVPGVGWIFMDRTPVRGHKSREVVKEAKRRKRSEADPATTRLPAEVTGLDVAAPKPRNRPKSVDRAIARATQEVVEPSGGPGRRRRRGGQPPADPVNEPLPFITFIAAHPLGSEVIGSVGEYSSHGAFVEADGAKCYIPLSAMGDPPPRRAREVVTKGQPVTFVVQAFDPQRRGIELALPGFAHIAGGPTPETVDAEIHPDAVEKPRRRGRAAKAGSAPAAAEPALVRAGSTDGPAAGPGDPVSEEAGVGGQGAAKAGRGGASSVAKKPTGKPAVLSVAKQPAEEAAVEEKARRTRKTKQQPAAPSEQPAAPSEKAAEPAKAVKTPSKRTRKTGGTTQADVGEADAGSPVPAGQERAARRRGTVAEAPPTPAGGADGSRGQTGPAEQPSATLTGAGPTPGGETGTGEQAATTTAPAKRARKARAVPEAAPSPAGAQEQDSQAPAPPKRGRKSAGSPGRDANQSGQATAKAKGTTTTAAKAPAAKAGTSGDPAKGPGPAGGGTRANAEDGGAPVRPVRKSSKSEAPGSSKAGGPRKSAARGLTPAGSEDRTATTGEGGPAGNTSVRTSGAKKSQDPAGATPAARRRSISSPS